MGRLRGLTTRWEVGMFGKPTGSDRLSAYAGEFVPTGERPARQRRGSDPTLSALRTEENDADRSNPRLPYQLQPNARPRVLAHHEPYPGSPAAALRGQVYERLEEMVGSYRQKLHRAASRGAA